MDLFCELARQGFPCLFRRMTGLYCPGCGGSRAARYLLRGDIGKSLWYHPLVGYAVLVAAVEFGGWLWAKGGEGRRGKTGAARFLGHYEAEVYVGAGIIAANWVIKNGVLLTMGVKLIP